MTGRPSYGEGVGFGVLSFGVLALLGLVTSIVIARLYGVTVLGQYALATAPVNILFALSSAREQVALVRELSALPPRAPRITGLFYAVLAFSFALTAVFALATIATVYVLFNGPIDQPTLFLPTVAYVAGYTLVQNTCWNLDMVFSAFRAGRELLWTRLNQAVAFVVFAVAGGLLWATVWMLVVATVLSFATALVHKVVVARRYMRGAVPRSELAAGFKALPAMIRFGLKVAPGQVADGISYEAGTLTLGILSPVAAVGAYNRAWQLGRRFLDLQWKVTEMLFPTLVGRHGGGDQDGFDRALVDSIRYSVVGMLLPAAAMGGAATGVMRVFGSGFGSGSGALVLIMLMPALTTVSAIQRGSLVAVNRPWTTAVSGLIRLAVTLAATIALTLRFGATGAAGGLIAGTFADLVYTSCTTRRHLSHPLRHLWPMRQMASTLIAYGAGFAVSRGVYTVMPTWSGLALALLVSTSAYVLVFLLCGGLAERDRTRIASAVLSLRRRRGVLAAG